MPGSPADLTSAVLSNALGRSVVVTGVARVGEEFGFSGEAYRVELEVAEGPAAVIAKLWALTEPDDVRELRFYRELAGDTPTRLPAFYDGGVDSAAGRAWLVIETLDGFRQGDELVSEPLGTVLSLVTTMAQIHAAWWDQVTDRAWLPPARQLQLDPEYLATRRTEYLERFGPIQDRTVAGLFDEIPAMVRLATDVLSGAPETLLHLDLGLDNVLFLPPDDRPVPIDWARCGRGPGVHDLTSILFGTAPLDRFAEVVDCYIAVLHEFGLPVAVDPAAVRRWLGGAMIHEFVTRTLGVARWKATTPRGLKILDQWVERTPQIVAAWRDFDGEIFEQLRF